MTEANAATEDFSARTVADKSLKVPPNAPNAVLFAATIYTDRAIEGMFGPERGVVVIVNFSLYSVPVITKSETLGLIERYLA